MLITVDTPQTSMISADARALNSFGRGFDITRASFPAVAHADIDTDRLALEHAGRRRLS